MADQVWLVDENFEDVTLNFKGVDIKLKVKPLTWSRKNQILSGALSIGQDGAMHFNFDKYMKDVLVDMIVDAPWGKTTHIMLNKMKPEFGTMLEKIAPKAFGSGEGPNDFFGKEQKD